MSQKLSEFGLIPLRASRRKDGGYWRCVARMFSSCPSPSGRRAFSELSGSLNPWTPSVEVWSVWLGVQTQSEKKCKTTFPLVWLSLRSDYTSDRCGGAVYDLYLSIDRVPRSKCRQNAEWVAVESVQMWVVPAVAWQLAAVGHHVTSLWSDFQMFAKNAVMDMNDSEYVGQSMIATDRWYWLICVVGGDGELE